ncbi:MAG: enoyl-CoA hydratase [Rhodospirillales bacterium]
MSALAHALPNEESLVLETLEQGVLTLTLNRPRQYNALSEGLLQALSDALERAGDNPEVRVVVLAAAGKAFCAGHDLKEMRGQPRKDYYQTLFAACSRLMLTVTRIPQPVIARVHGIATAAGCQLVAQCDLAVAAEEARFATSGINAGLFCSTPAVAVTRNLPRKRAFELLFTGDFIDARTAADWGLINRVVPAERLDAEVEALAQRIVAKSAAAVATGKRMVYTQMEKGMEAAYTYAAEAMACNMMAEDAGEGIDAFIEKRPAEWRHR